jgi:hypothetical protein
MAVMWQIFAFSRMRPNFALDEYVARAGCAMACAYSSSDEFEAAVIRAKRAAGVYGWRRHRLLGLWLGLAVGAVVILTAAL